MLLSSVEQLQQRADTYQTTTTNLDRLNGSVINELIELGASEPDRTTSFRNRAREAFLKRYTYAMSAVMDHL